MTSRTETYKPMRQRQANRSNCGPPEYQLAWTSFTGHPNTCLHVEQFICHKS